MSDEINVLSRTQHIFVEPVSGAVSIIYAGGMGPPGPTGIGETGPTGPMGPTGPAGTAETRVIGNIILSGVTTATTVNVPFTVTFDGEPKVTFWTTISSDTMTTWAAHVRGWDETAGEYSGFDIRYSSSGAIIIHFAVEGAEV